MDSVLITIVVLALVLPLVFAIIMIATYAIYSVFFASGNANMRSENYFIVGQAVVVVKTLFYAVGVATASGIAEVGARAATRLPRLFVYAAVAGIFTLALNNAGTLVKAGLVVRQCGAERIVSTTINPLLEIARLIYNVGIAIFNFYREISRLLTKSIRGVTKTCSANSGLENILETLGTILLTFFAALGQFLGNFPLTEGELNIITTLERIGDLIDILEEVLVCACRILDFAWALVSRVLQLPSLFIALNAVVGTAVELIQVFGNAVINNTLTFEFLFDEIIDFILFGGDAIEDAVFVLFEVIVGIITNIVNATSGAEIQRRNKNHKAGLVRSDAPLTPMIKLRMLVDSSIPDYTPQGLSSEEAADLYRIMYPLQYEESHYRGAMEGFESLMPLTRNNTKNAFEHNAMAHSHRTRLAIQDINAKLYDDLIPDELIYYLAPDPGFTRIITEIAAGILRIVEIFLNALANIDILFTSDGEVFWVPDRSFDHFDQAVAAFSNLFLLAGIDVAFMIRYGIRIPISVGRTITEFIRRLLYLDAQNFLEFTGFMREFYDDSVNLGAFRQPMPVEGDHLFYNIYEAAKFLSRFIGSINSPMGQIADGLFKVIAGFVRLFSQIGFYALELIQFKTFPTTRDLDIDPIFIGAVTVAIGMRDFVWQFNGQDYIAVCGDQDTSSFFCCSGSFVFEIVQILIIAIREIVDFAVALIGLSSGLGISAEELLTFDEIILRMESTICEMGCIIGFAIPFSIPCFSDSEVTKRECETANECIGSIPCEIGRFLIGFLTFVNSLYNNLVYERPLTGDGEFGDFIVVLLGLTLRNGANVIYAVAHTIDCFFCTLEFIGLNEEQTDNKECGPGPIYTFLSTLIDPIIDLVIGVIDLLLNVVSLFVSFFASLFGGDPLGAFFNFFIGLFDIFVVDLGRLILGFLKRIPLIGDIITFFGGKRSLEDTGVTVKELVRTVGLDTATLPFSCNEVTNYQDSTLSSIPLLSRKAILYCIAVYSWENGMPSTHTRTPYTFVSNSDPASPPLTAGDPRVAAEHSEIPNQCDDVMMHYAQSDTRYSSLTHLEVSFAIDCFRTRSYIDSASKTMGVDFIPSDLMTSTLRQVRYPIDVFSEMTIWRHYSADRLSDPHIVASPEYQAKWKAQGLWVGHYELITGPEDVVSVIGQYTVYDYMLRNHAEHPEAVARTGNAISQLFSFARSSVMNATQDLSEVKSVTLSDFKLGMSDEELSRYQYQSIKNVFWGIGNIYSGLGEEYTKNNMRRNYNEASTATRQAMGIAIDTLAAYAYNYTAEWSAYRSATGEIQRAQLYGFQPSGEAIRIRDDAILGDKLYTFGNSFGNAVSIQAVWGLYDSMKKTNAPGEITARTRERYYEDMHTLLPASLTKEARVLAKSSVDSYLDTLQQTNRPDYKSAFDGMATTAVNWMYYVTQGTPNANIRAAKFSMLKDVVIETMSRKAILSYRRYKGIDEEVPDTPEQEQEVGSRTYNFMQTHPRAYLFRMGRPGIFAYAVEVGVEACGEYVGQLCEICFLVATIIEGGINAILFLLEYYQSFIFTGGFTWSAEASVVNNNEGYIVVGSNATLPVRFPNPDYPVAAYLNPGYIESDNFVELGNILFGNGTDFGEPTNSTGTFVVPEPDMASVNGITFALVFAIFGSLLDSITLLVDSGLDGFQNGVVSAASIITFLLDWFNSCDYRDEFDSSRQHASLGETIFAILRVFLGASFIVGLFPFDLGIVTGIISTGYATILAYATLSLTYNWSFRCFPSLPWMLANDIIYLWRFVIFPPCDIFFSGSILGQYDKSNCYQCDAVKDFKMAHYIRDAGFGDIRANLVFSLREMFPSSLDGLTAIPVLGMLFTLILGEQTTYFDALDMSDSEIYSRHYYFNILSLPANMSQYFVLFVLVDIVLPVFFIAANLAFVLIYVYAILIVLGVFSSYSLIMAMKLEESYAYDQSDGENYQPMDIYGYPLQNYKYAEY